MTESEWDSCSDPRTMLGFLQDSGRASDRKLRLFAVACCRRVLPVTTNYRLHEAMETLERDGEGAIRERRRTALRKSVKEVAQSGMSAPEASVAWAIYSAADRNAWAAAHCFCWAVAAAAGATNNAVWPADMNGHAAASAELGVQCDLVRDIFGPLPFRPVAVCPPLLIWQNGLVPRLAKASYDDRLLPSGRLDPTRLLVLADALDEAGCDDAELIQHLRGPGPHGRGCFVVDLLLGKS